MIHPIKLSTLTLLALALVGCEDQQPQTMGTLLGNGWKRPITR